MKGPGIGLVIVGAGALLLLFGGTAKAAPKPSGGPSAQDQKALGDAQWADTVIKAALVQCQDPQHCNPKVLRNAAAQLRAHTYANADVQAQAYKAANDLEAEAQQVEDYQAQIPAIQQGGTAYNPEYGDQSAWNEALGPLGG